MQVQSQLQLRFKVRNDYLSKLGTKGHSNLKPNTIQSYGQSEIQRLRKKDHLKLYHSQLQHLKLEYANIVSLSVKVREKHIKILLNHSKFNAGSKSITITFQS